MSASNVVTLRMPADLKHRLEHMAKRQGVSMNQLTNYFLNRDITEAELELSLERRLEKASLRSLKNRARSVLDKVPSRPVPRWDRMD